MHIFARLMHVPAWGCMLTMAAEHTPKPMVFGIDSLIFDCCLLFKQRWPLLGMATCTQHSFDFCLAWALIGEWTSRILFPVPKGPWPRHGHAGALLPGYRARSLRIVAWARASFQQGALPSLLLLRGLVPIFTLPGGKMFQSTGVCRGRQRPPIMHAYGGAKIGMAQALRSIANEGWVPLAAAMVGTTSKKPCGRIWGFDQLLVPQWTQPLEDRELDLLLSCRRRWDHTSIPECALNTWLTGVDCEFGPDCEDSPHFRRPNMLYLG